MKLEMTSCCGLSLKAGTIIIGVLESIFSFMALILTSAYAENPHELLNISDPSVVPDLTVLKSILIVLAVGCALQCMFAIFLIFAAVTNRPLLLVPWLVLNPVALFFYIVCTLIAICHHADDNRSIFVVGHLISALTASVIVSLKTLVVYNFYRHLKSLNF